jgi:hypothetical protein
MSFDDTRKSLAAKFRAETRFANFGPVLERVNVSGFRGISQSSRRWWLSRV